MKNPLELTAEELDSLYPTKIGIVAVLDVLGVKNWEDTETKRFLAIRDALVGEMLERHSEIIYWVIENVDGEKKMKRKQATVRAVAHTFGDTLVLTWESDIPTKFLLVACGETLQDFLAHSLEVGLPFRGCLAAARFFSDDRNSVVGPAVSQAASWYEDLQMVGVVISPSTGMLLHSMYGSDLWNSEAGYSETFVLYNAPMRSGITQFWTIAWPFKFPYGSSQKRLDGQALNPDQLLAVVLSNTPIPKGAEYKVNETMKYFAHCKRLSKPSDG